MKISFNWLKDYIQINETPEKIAEYLTDCGLEVEGLEKVESVRGGLKGLITGEVIKCEKHPDADRLSVTEVNIGKEILPIVCGAPNVAKGQKVVVATVGTTLYPSQGGEFAIKKAKIRGQQSRGMICAEDEIGLGDDHEGIIVLDDDTEIGVLASDYFKIESDWCIEIGLTPNRIDAASHIGVARDLLAVLRFNEKTDKTALNLPDVSGFKPVKGKNPVKVTVEDSQACPRYSGIFLTDIKVNESPGWLKNRLTAIGLKPINNVVDITNYVLHETGQPLHAFDGEKISGDHVIVKKPGIGTKFITLDEQEIELSGNDLMICDEKNPMCIAGVFGGVDSGVTHNTQSIFLESAYFDATTIRKTSKHHGINTDASFRFERGADPEITIYALKRAALLMKQIAGARIASDISDSYPVPVKPKNIQFRYATADKIIGKRIRKESIKNILTLLGIKILQASEDVLNLEIPSYKVDVTREADIVEEILRIYGYNNIEIPVKLHTSMVSSPVPDKAFLQNKIADMLVSRGFTEIMNNSLTKRDYYSKQNGFDPALNVEILNPLSQDLNAMRQSLLFGGLETILWNQNRKLSEIKVFEFGNTYSREKDDTAGQTPLTGFRETMQLGLFMSGNLEKETWYQPQKKAGLFDLKSEIMHLIKKLNLDINLLSLEEISNHPLFETGIRYWSNNNVLIEMGLISGKLLQKNDIKQEVYFGTINWDLAIELCNNNPVMFTDIPRFPEVRRDLALLVDTNVRFADIEKIAFQTEKKLLKSVRLFDIYQDKKIGEDKKSYAVSFYLQNLQKTMQDKEIDKVINKIAQKIQKQTGAEIRS